MQKPWIAAMGIAAALAVLAAPAAAQDLTPEGRGAYAALAGANEAYQLRAAELALEKAGSPELRAYAETMLAEHRERLARFEAIARAAGLEEQLPPAMLPRHWEMLRRLEQRSGGRFERTYAAQQVESHDLAVALHRNFAANGTGPRLLDFARAAAPVAERHLDAARRLGD
jgi:putative membrane protein